MSSATPVRTRCRRRARRILGLFVCAALLSSCGGGDARPQEVIRGCSADAPNSEGWTGDSTHVDEVNAFLAAAPPPISTSPCDAARVLLRLDRAQEEGTTVELSVEPEDAASARVTVVFEGFADDSVAAQRWIFAFEPAEGDRVRLTTVTVEQRCQPGRGQQEFAPGICS